MDSKSAAKLAFGNPGFLDFITVPIVSALTGQSQKNVQFASQFVPPTFGPSTLVEPLVRTAAKFVPEAQTFVDLADSYVASDGDDAEDDPLGNDGDY